jgi:hypothetical protein
MREKLFKKMMEDETTGPLHATCEMIPRALAEPCIPVIGGMTEGERSAWDYIRKLVERSTAK